MEVSCDHPLATLHEQFLKEPVYLKNVTPRTIVWYRIAFKNYLASLRTETEPFPTKDTLQRFVIHENDRRIRPVTCNTYIAAMNAFCRWLHEEHHISERLKLPKLRVEQRVLTLLDDRQIRSLLTYKANKYAQWRVHAAALTVLDIGLRVSEMIGLRQPDIDIDNLLFKVFGKGQKERLVPFSTELRRWLYRFEKVKQAKAIRGDHVFADSMVSDGKNETAPRHWCAVVATSRTADRSGTRGLREPAAAPEKLSDQI